MCESGSPVMVPPRETDCGGECRAGGLSAKAMSTSVLWNLSMFELLGVIEGGMPGRNGQRKLGTTRGSPRRSRTAKASRISRIVGEIAMCPRVGRMGLISVDGPGQKNPDRSESPWGGVEPPLQGGASRSRRPGTERDNRIRLWGAGGAAEKRES